MLRIAFLCEFRTINGGEHSLLAVLDRLRGDVEPIFLAPAAGPLSIAIRTAGWSQVAFDVRDEAGTRRSSADIESELLQLIRAIAPDLLHANSLSMGRLSGRLSLQLPCPSTTHLRDILRLNRQTIDDLNRNASLFAVSSATRSFHVAQGLDAGRAFVLYNGVDTGLFRPAHDAAERNAVRAALGLSTDAILALTIGQIGQRKGLDVLVDSAGAITSACPRMHFVVIGERYSTKPEAIHYEQSLLEKIERRGLGPRFHWLGYRADISQLMRGADILIHPARQEPFGRVLLEAAACGLPIVATDVGGTAEMLAAGLCVELVSPGSSERLARAVNKVMESPSRQAELGRQARDRVQEHFTVEKAATGLLQHWRRVLAAF